MVPILAAAEHTDRPVVLRTVGICSGVYTNSMQKAALQRSLPRRAQRMESEELKSLVKGMAIQARDEAIREKQRVFLRPTRSMAMHTNHAGTSIKLRRALLV